MFSYRHAFHAGNHADVLKHILLLQLLDYFNQKDKPYLLIDTHAGAGLYALDQGYAQQNAEYRDGIGRLAAASRLSPALDALLALVRDCNDTPEIRIYPGSPVIALHRLRASDRLRLFEMHPTDTDILRQNMAAAGRQVKVETSDGFAGLRALLPPPTRRALVLIDPPYEDKDDYQTVVRTLKDGLSRFASGTFAVWYPLLQRHEPLRMVETLTRLGCDWLDVRLQVSRPAAGGFGMFGSGMFILNPPWTFPALLKGIMPELVRLLAQDDAAGYHLDDRIA